MRLVLRLLLAGAVLATPVLGVTLGSKSCQHACPFAQKAHAAGQQVVGELPLASVSAGELES